MKNKNIITPFPLIERPSNEAVKKVSQMSRKDRRKFKKSYAYKKYVKPVLDREREQKQKRLWLREHWIEIAGLFVTIISLVATILFSA